jgi:polysaccharide export outer membrane protein
MRAREQELNIRLWLAASVCALLTACQTAAVVTPQGQAGAAAAKQGQAGAANAFASQTDYRLSPQDTVEVSVFQAPSLNRTAQIDGNGQLALPLIGGVVAAGKTTRELEAEIAAKLGAKYLQSPQVAVSIKDGLGQRYTVDGAIKKPGVYNARGETTLLRALAEAGGPDEVADRDGITLFRVTNQQRVSMQYSLSAIRSGQAPDPPVYGGDTIIVNESVARNAWRMVKDVGGAAGMARGFVP